MERKYVEYCTFCGCYIPANYSVCPACHKDVHTSGNTRTQERLGYDISPMRVSVRENHPYVIHDFWVDPRIKTVKDIMDYCFVDFVRKDVYLDGNRIYGRLFDIPIIALCGNSAHRCNISVVSEPEGYSTPQYRNTEKKWR